MCVASDRETEFNYTPQKEPKPRLQSSSNRKSYPPQHTCCSIKSEANAHFLLLPASTSCAMNADNVVQHKKNWGEYTSFVRKVLRLI